MLNSDLGVGTVKVKDIMHSKRTKAEELVERLDYYTWHLPLSLEH